MPNPVGRPKKWNSAEELDKEIQAYFEECKNNNDPICITGLCLVLECDRLTLINYSKDEEFFNTIKKAKQVCENYAEKHLYNGKNVAGSIFNLKNNYAWKDKTEIDHGINKLGLKALLSDE